MILVMIFLIVFRHIIGLHACMVFSSFPLFLGMPLMSPVWILWCSLWRPFMLAVEVGLVFPVIFCQCCDVLVDVC